MTEAVLISIIFNLCGVYGDSTDRVMCFERLTNCAVKDGGKILTLKEFQKQCLK